MKLTIEQVNNGYIIQDKERTVVCEELETEYGELDCAVNLLHEILDMLGIYGDKYTKQIKIEVVKGAKV